jgi:shikimate kinase
MERTWILLGMMGAGKSAVGRSLSQLSGRGFNDTDLLIQHRLGRPVGQIFDLYGEQAFRDHETSVLTSLQPCAEVLATGGGIIGREENWVHLRRLGHTIYLKAEFSTLRERLERSRKRRPMLETEGWEARLEQLLAARLPLYERADVVVQVDGLEIEDAAQLVLKAIQELQ